MSDHEEEREPLELPADCRAGQSAVTLTYGAIAMVPVIGALIQASLNVAYPGPQAAADREWMKDVVQRINELEERGKVDVQALIDDAQFDRVVRRVVQEIRNEGEQKKREAYKSLIINYAQGRTFAEYEEKRLLGYLERYSALHLQVLTLMDDPKKQFPNGGRGLHSSIPNMLRIAFPQNSDDELGRCYTDLMDDGLLSRMRYGVMMTAEGAYVPRIEKLGKKMLRIIDNPEEVA